MIKKVVRRRKLETKKSIKKDVGPIPTDTTVITTDNGYSKLFRILAKGKKVPVWPEKGCKKPRAVKPSVGKVIDIQRGIDEKNHIAEFAVPTQGIDVTDMTREQLLEMALLPFALSMDFYEWHDESHSAKGDSLKEYHHSSGASNILLARAVLGARTDAELKQVRVFAKRFGWNEVNDDNTNYAILLQVVKACPDALGNTIKEKLASRPTPIDCSDCVKRNGCRARKDIV